jgi:hypothetical protein
LEALSGVEALVVFNQGCELRIYDSSSIYQSPKAVALLDESELLSNEIVMG